MATKQEMLETVNNWLNGKLSWEDESDVAGRVSGYPRENPWRDAYNEALSMFKDVHHRRLGRGDSLRVALDEHEIKQAMAFGGLCLNMPIPHEGRDASLLAVLTPEGVLFFTDIPHEERRSRLAPWGTKTFRWSDGVLDITFTLHECDFGVHTRMRQAATEVCSLAFGAGHSRAAEHVLNVIGHLQGYWVDVLANAAHAFKEALEDTRELEDQVATLLCLRVHLDILARRLSDPCIDFELEDADELLAKHKEGLLLLDERTYDRLTEEGPLDKHSWWGFPLLLEERVPVWWIEEALGSLHADGHTS